MLTLLDPTYSVKSKYTHTDARTPDSHGQAIRTELCRETREISGGLPVYILASLGPIPNIISIDPYVTSIVTITIVLVSSDSHN